MNVIDFGLKNLNIKSNYKYTKNDFGVGFVRNMPSYGIEYKLFYIKNHTCCSEIHLKRFFQPLDQNRVYKSLKKSINKHCS